MTTITKAQTEKLATIVSATQSASGMCYMTEKSVQVLVDAGFVECNITMTNPDDAKQVAVRATQTGVAHTEAPAPAEGTSPMNTPETVSAFSIEDAVPVPPISRAGKSTSVYPFHDLTIGEGEDFGQSFFVPATAEMPNPGKSLASTVSSASKRYATQNGTRMVNRKATAETAEAMGVAVGEMGQVAVPSYVYERKFLVRTVEENGVKGARVWRVNPNAANE